MLPAVGQGALGIEARADDTRTRSLLSPLNHLESHQAVLAERTLLFALRAGCMAPVGAWGRVEQGRLALDAVVLSPDGTHRLSASGSDAMGKASSLGQSVAEQLLKALMTRALSTTNDGRAWFDAGYLIEAYRQGDHLRADKKSATWAAVNETIRVDGYGFVKKAIAMTGPSTEMELAASLMTQGAVAEAHRARAAKAGPGSLVVKNLAKLAY